MVAKGSLYGKLLRSIDITLDNEVAVGRYPYIVRQTLYQLHRLAAQHACKQHLVHIVGHRCRCRVDVGGVATKAYAHGHTSFLTLVAVVVACAGLMLVPMHARGAPIENLHAIHAHIRNPRFGVECAYHRQRDEGPTVAAPRGEYWQLA